MEVKIKNNNKLIDATIEMVDGVMVVPPKEEDNTQYIPEKNSEYYTVRYNAFHLFFTEETVFYNDEIDRCKIGMGWVFPYTKEGREACNALCEKLNEAIKCIKL